MGNDAIKVNVKDHGDTSQAMSGLVALKYSCFEVYLR